MTRKVEPIGRRPERHDGEADPPAIAAALRARMRHAALRGDIEGEATAAARLARHLLSIDARVEEAVIVGRRALSLRTGGPEGARVGVEDDELRRNLAALLEALGEPGLAASMLRPVVDATCASASRSTDATDDAIYGLLALGDLLLRSGDLEGAIESFRYVTVVAPDRPEGQERVAIARGVAPSAVPADVAARAFIGAAKKHQIAGHDARALEDLGRAFECDSTNALAASVFADAIEELGRTDAADAVRAEHGHALAARGRLEDAAKICAGRREKAALRNDVATTLAATLDELVDLVTYTTPGSVERARAMTRVDLALATLGQSTAIAAPLLIARRRLHALLAQGDESVRAHRELVEHLPVEARLDAWVEVAASSIVDDQAFSALREHARTTRDPEPIVDALVRVLRRGTEGVDPAVYAARAAELALWAEERLDDPVLATWAWRRVISVTPSDARASAEIARLTPRVEAADGLLDAARAGAHHADIGPRNDARRQLVRHLAGRPDEGSALIDALAALLAEQPSDRTTVVVLERILGRLENDDAARALRLREECTAETNARSRARRARVELALRRGDVEGARSLANEAEFRVALAPMRIALAEHGEGGGELGQGLADFTYQTEAGREISARERAVTLAAAARAGRLAQKLGQARAHAEHGMRVDPRDLRAAYELAELAASARDALPSALAGASLERALGGIGPRARWALSLAALTDIAGERALSAAWTRRAWSLRPGDLEIARQWIDRAVALGDADLVAEVVRATTAAVVSLGALASELGAAVRALFATNGARGEEIVRELLALGAARLAPIRLAALDVARDRPALEIAVLERWLASGAKATERAESLLQIAVRARDASDPERGVDAIARLLEEPECTRAQREAAGGILAAFSTAKLTPDGELSLRRGLAAVRAEEAAMLLSDRAQLRLRPDEEARLREVADAHRLLGRDQWDLAGDREAALRAWLRGALLLGSEGLDRLEADIGAFGGDAAVRDALLELARKADAIEQHAWPPGALGPPLVAALQARAWERAIDRPPTDIEPWSLAREALARSVDPAALLPAVERLAARTPGTEAQLIELYEMAAGRAVGKYGERGVRYRAARVLDRIGRPEAALQQAARAFSAVPSEGAILMLLERLGRTTQRPDVVITTLVEAADGAESERRATWLDRAAQVAKDGVADPAERFDLMLRLFLTAPSARTCGSAVETLRAAAIVDPAVAESMLARLRRAHQKVDGKLGYADRLPVLGLIASLVAEYESVTSSLDLIAQGAASTPRQDLDPLRDIAEAVAQRDPEAARAWLERTAQVKPAPGGPVRAHVAFGAGDPDTAIRELTLHAPETDEFDFTEPSEGPTRELRLLEKWARHARDKRSVAEAWAKLDGGKGSGLESARALDESGQTDAAAQAIVEAWKNRARLAPPHLADLLVMAREILPHAGAYRELVEILVDDLEKHPPQDRADGVARWREIAELRTDKLADRVGTLDALVEAGRIASNDEDLWSEITELAESLGVHDRLAAALAHRLQRARPDKRVILLRRLARTLEHDLARLPEASERWAELTRLLPLDAEAADALERIAEHRADRTQLVELLRARAGRLPPGHADRTRALRRLARELEGTPSRRGEVLSAIREVHQQRPTDAEVTLELARLARAAGDVGTAAEALMRSFRAITGDASNQKVRVSLAIEGARALLELHDYETAGRLLAEASAEADLAKDVRGLELLQLMLEVAIARGDARDEAMTRIRIAELDADAPSAKRASNCMSAARALLAMGDHPRARELAWAAARSATGDPAAAALLAELEFGAGAGRPLGKILAADGELLAILAKIAHTATAPADQLAIIAFARAELLDATQSVGAGYRDLHGWPDEVRAQPLVQLAFAERLAAEWSFAQATGAYERAFAGDLRGFRATGPAALRAADAAARSNDPNRARAFLDLAARDPACRVDARKRAVELARALGDTEGAIRALQRLAAEATGVPRAMALAEQARMLKTTDAEGALETMRLAVEASLPGSELRRELEAEMAAIDEIRSRHSLPPSPPPALRDSATSARFVGEHAQHAMLRQLTDIPERHLESSRPSQPETPPVPVGPPSPATGTDPAAANALGVPPSGYMAPNSSSEPPPEAMRVPNAAPQLSPSEQPPSAPDPVAETQRATDSKLLAVAAAAEEAKQATEAARADEAAQGDELTDQPRLTVVGEAPAARAVPALPRPAQSSAPLDLAALDKLALDTSAPVVERIRALKTLGEAAHEGARLEDAVRHFISALELGDISAGDGAAELLGLLPGRSGDLLLVRRRQAFLAPGDPSLLDALHEAIRTTRDHVFARAVDHVRRAFDPIAGPVPPPPLDQQLDRPDLVVPLLERRANAVAAEALRIAWEHASALFRRDIGSYGIGGMDRPPGSSGVGRVIASANRLLGARAPVFVRHRSGRDVEAVLLVPPTVVLGGDCREDTAQTRYLAGVGFVAAHPSHALLLAQPMTAARATWQALLSAFGPPEHGRGVAPEVGRLAASLWQAIPRGPQRRLGELLANPPSFEAAVEGARQVARRTGLYLSGDLDAAVRTILAETGEEAMIRGRGPAELAAICQRHPPIADLVRLATSPEFAEARWRSNAAPGQRRTPSGNLNSPR